MITSSASKIWGKGSARLTACSTRSLSPRRRDGLNNPVAVDRAYAGSILPESGWHRQTAIRALSNIRTVTDDRLIAEHMKTLGGSLEQWRMRSVMTVIPASLWLLVIARGFGRADVPVGTVSGPDRNALVVAPMARRLASNLIPWHVDRDDPVDGARVRVGYDRELPWGAAFSRSSPATGQRHDRTESSRSAAWRRIHRSRSRPSSAGGGPTWSRSQSDLAWPSEGSSCACPAPEEPPCDS